MLAQIENLNDFASAIKNISTSSTITIIEFPYLFYMLEKSLFDLIYHEHLSYFNLTSLQVLFNKNMVLELIILKNKFRSFRSSSKSVCSTKIFKHIYSPIENR